MSGAKVNFSIHSLWVQNSEFFIISLTNNLLTENWIFAEREEGNVRTGRLQKSQPSQKPFALSRQLERTTTVNRRMTILARKIYPQATYVWTYSFHEDEELLDGIYASPRLVLLSDEGSERPSARVEGPSQRGTCGVRILEGYQQCA